MRYKVTMKNLINTSVIDLVEKKTLNYCNKKTSKLFKRSQNHFNWLFDET